MADPMLNRHSRENGNSDSSSPESLITATAKDGGNVDCAGAIIDHIDIWTTAIERKSSAGRGTSNKFSLYGIKKLRELILELAVRGKLVPQASFDERNSPDYESASVSLERIAVEKAQLVKEGNLKKQKPLPEISDDEKPFELPNGWEWSRLGDFVSIIRGITFPSSEKHRELAPSRVACIRTTNVQDSLEWDDLLYVDRSYVKREEQYLKLGDIVMSMANSRELVGKVSFITHIPVGESSFGGFLSVIRPYQFDASFLMSVLRAPLTKNELIGSASQTTNIANISLEKLNPLVIAVPPLEEQHRIVAKVDELMSLCDALEAQTEASISAHQTLVETLLNALLQPNTTQPPDSQSTSGSKPANPKHLNAASLEHAGANSLEPSFAHILEPALNNSFIDSWQRVAEHFDTLFTTAASIDTLKQTILQLAVMGKLVPQASFDEINSQDYEPASKLLERIAAEKVKLIADKKIKKQKTLPTITDEEKPFELQKGWAFAYMQELCSLITDGTHQTPKYAEEGRPFISAQCVKPFKFMPENCRYVSEEHYQAYIKNRKPEYKDILLARVGAGIGEAALIDSELEFAIYVSTGLLKPHKCSVESEYLVLWLNSPIGRGFSESNTLGKGVSQGNLNLSLIRSFVVSLPPLEEQQRIVAKVDELITLCDQLKSCLSDTQTTQLNLTDTILEQAVS
jgi:type I restriction enzyme S subunit